MPFVKHMKGMPTTMLAAEGLMYQDWDAVTSCQRECTNRFGLSIQQEQEAYMINHPEIVAMLKIFVAEMTQRLKRKDLNKEAAFHFTRSFAELDEEIRAFLESPPDGHYIAMEDRKKDEYEDGDFLKDMRDIIINNFPPEPWDLKSSPPSTIKTESSSFISINTSEITLPTPEPVPPPEPTTSEIFYKLISNTVDKAIYTKVDEAVLLYDIAYVQLMKAVEQAMEIPVLDIKADLTVMFGNAFRAFESNIRRKEKLAASLAWEKRMRKKMKRSLRIQKNFRGYETPPSTESSKTSRTEKDYRTEATPPRPCPCQPLATYNRYKKDRFGIYLPTGSIFNKKSITTTPVVSSEMLSDYDDILKGGSKSTLGKRSQTTTSAKSFFATSISTDTS